MRNIYFIIFIVFFMSSCTPKNYNIDGVVDNKELDGTTIFIKERINRVWISIDSTKIENGKFTFQGISDTAKIAYLVYEFPKDNRTRQAFILENGKLKVSIDTTGFMIFMGTKQNELLQNYQNSKNDFYIKTELINKSFKDSLKTESGRLEFDKIVEKQLLEEVNIDKIFALNHINTLVGAFVFMNSFYNMNIIEKESIISLMNDETKNITRIKEIISDIETEKKVAIGNQFIDFKLPGINGDSISLSDLVGKTDFLLVDFWASWCGPCMQSIPEIKTLYNTYHGSKFEILGVSLDDNETAWKSTVNNKQLNWKHVSDLKGWKCAGSRIYAVNSIPSTFLLDKTGKIIGKNMSISQMTKIICEKVEKKLK